MQNPVEIYDEQMEDAKEMVLQAAFLLHDAQMRIAKLKGQEPAARPISRLSLLK